MKKKIAVGLSGGIDSSVAASLLQEQGYEVTGVTMRFHVTDVVDVAQQENIQSASEVAKALNIDYRIIDFTEQFRRIVIDYFVKGYERGETPNPCFICNRYIKFGALWEACKDLGFEAIATGHYACIRYNEQKQRYQLLANPDISKDQSYFLAGLSQTQLSHIVFPLEKYTKEQVKVIAAQKKLPTVSRKESQDICFVPDGEYPKVIEQFAQQRFLPGHFLSTDGAILGQHKGLHYYTIGQRRGLHISTGEPVYVCAKHANTNAIVVGERNALYCAHFFVRELNIVASELLETLQEHDVQISVKTRYRTQAKRCIVHALLPSDYEVPNGKDVRLTPEALFRVTLLEKDFAVAQGQVAVFYGAGEVLASGIISKIEGHFSLSP